MGSFPNVLNPSGCLSLDRMVPLNTWLRPLAVNETLTLMKRVPITLENETTTPVGRVELRVTRKKCIKNVGLRRLRA
uniref:Uncharacterized protein n=1 Tax=Candidatus Kentrum sp. SD TaxID=2126332 RepID=A0A451BQJ2_9GAMM|nr:MAG: hypothetical protein BECKSD772D_GA0070982_11305 [Candidatus Kentron sp. SD]